MHVGWHVRCVIVMQAPMETQIGIAESDRERTQYRKKGVSYVWRTYSLVVRSTIRSHRIALAVWNLRLDPIQIEFE